MNKEVIWDLILVVEEEKNDSEKIGREEGLGN